MPSAETSSSGSHRLDVLELILRPLVRFCLRYGHSFQEFLAVAKRLFVQLAEEEIRKTSSKVNVSRISVMTGLNRSEVDRLFGPEPEGPAERLGVLTRVLGQWRNHHDFTTSTGQPRSLTYRGEDSEFKQLVATVSKNINPGTVLFELQRKGYLKKTRQHINLQKEVFSLQSDPHKGFDLVARDIETLLQASEQNIYNLQPVSNLHIRTEYDNIIKSKLPEIRRWLVDEGKHFHKRARDYLSALDKDVNPGTENEEAGCRVTVTAFSFTSEGK